MKAMPSRVSRTCELRVSRAAFYHWRRGTGPAEVRLPAGGVRIRSALQASLRRLEQPQQEDTPE